MVLQVGPQPYDVAALEHRAFLIDRCKYAAALLFGVANQVGHCVLAMAQTSYV